jgi:hypothetical protein
MPESGEKGVCRLSVVAVRLHPSDTSEMVTQLLFGDHYSVIDRAEAGKWLRINIYFDGYEGWIDATQHYSISREYFDQINASDYKICTDISSSILFKKRNIEILLGSILPISNSELFKMEEQLAFNGESKSLGQRREFEFLRQVAYKYRYAPYLWGGKTPFGVDCSGFVQMVYKICGYKLKRDAKDQALQGVGVAEFAEAEPGDLFFFGLPTKITHVGIYTGDGKILHAHGMVREDTIIEQGIFNEQLQSLTHQYQLIRRILK